jgi:hypothetical protein
LFALLKIMKINKLKLKTLPLLLALLQICHAQVFEIFDCMLSLNTENSPYIVDEDIEGSLEYFYPNQEFDWKNNPSSLYALPGRNYYSVLTWYGIQDVKKIEPFNKLTSRDTPLKTDFILRKVEDVSSKNLFCALFFGANSSTPLTKAVDVYYTGSNGTRSLRIGNVDGKLFVSMASCQKKISLASICEKALLPQLDSSNISRACNELPLYVSKQILELGCCVGPGFPNELLYSLVSRIIELSAPLRTNLDTVLKLEEIKLNSGEKQYLLWIFAPLEYNRVQTYILKFDDAFLDEITKS